MVGFRNGGASSVWTVSLVRGVVAGLVLALHLALFMGLIATPAPLPPPQARQAATAADTIAIRFIAVPGRGPALAPIRLRPLPSSRDVSARPPRATATDAPIDRAGPFTTRQRADARDASRHDYIPGGAAFTGRLNAAQHPRAIALPGAGATRLPGVHMIDPRTRGIAGLARFIGGMVGVVDAHCVDVDVWQGMTTAELGRRGMSAGRVQRVAENYGCKQEAPRRPDMTRPNGPGRVR